MNFANLVQTIGQTHAALQQQTNKAINRNLTIRNWLIGFYIVEFEQKGEDRAKYGDSLIRELAKKINIPGLAFRSLHLFRSFYLSYPQIAQTLSAQLKGLDIESTQILQTPSAKLHGIDIQQNTLQVPPEKLISKLSFSHLVELLQINESLKRTYYEIECIKGNWSIRELRRQINSLYYERSGLSRKPEKLSALITENAEQLQPVDIIKSVYTFEFLGLYAKDVVEESSLETALLDHLQQFMLELGHGFCLEARQKRILIGDEYYFIDLVFYHRILKCHVLVDLKIEEFTYANAGQLNTYLNYYKAEVLLPDDNPPVGILLVTNKNQTLVEYATAGMDRQLFVSKYMVELPSKEQLEKFVQNELKQL
jgi:predicted nuclease of restriction endonuclease-like (RecB) superfamily